MDLAKKSNKILEWLRGLLFLVREFMLTMLEAGPPVDWDQQCQDAVADDQLS